MCMKEETVKRKHGSRRQRWAGEGAIERLYLGPDWPGQALSPQAELATAQS